MQIERRHAAVFKRVKSMLPRRESERRIHPLFRHCDILSAVETRISMLNMTYMKYIQNNVCCFIPGKVLDELDRVLNIVEKADAQNYAPPRTHEILQELRDISSMAMEYFDEKILPGIKGKSTTAAIIPINQASISSRGSKIYLVQSGLQDEIRKMTRHNKKQKTHITCLTKIVHKLYNKIEKQSKRIKRQATLLQDNKIKIEDQTVKLQDQEITIIDLKRHVDEWDQKFSDLTAEIVRSRDEFFRAVFPPLPVVNTSVTTITHKTVTKPRLSQVQAPNTYLMELERKRKASIDFEIPNKLRFIAPRESHQLKDDVTNLINNNITKNISKNIRESDDDLEDTTKKKADFSSFFSTSFETLLRNPINSIKSRKRRMSEDLDLR